MCPKALNAPPIFFKSTQQWSLLFEFDTHDYTQRSTHISDRRSGKMFGLVVPFFSPPWHGHNTTEQASAAPFAPQPLLPWVVQ